ncbi:MAG: zinc transporter, family [Solirubrobacteraceae bacterium]|nr:zinc transporter, family [Solirubrobacteraceae bacterium]
MLKAIGLGGLSAGSLVLGVLVAFAHSWSPRQIGIVLAFGAGALISAVSFELADEGLRLGGFGWTAAGLAAGALTYYLLDGVIERRPSSGGGTALALGAFLDGIPEQLVLGIGIASGEGVGIGLLVAIFISNLPEATGSASAMLEGSTSRGAILRLWTAVALVCTVATAVGWAIASSAPDELRAGIDGFAAGALLVMLIDSMIPDARKDAGRAAGLVTTLGFAVAVALSSLT